MIVPANGDIFQGKKTEAIVNLVNCVGVPGAGLAKQFKEHYPEETQKYVEACRKGLVKPGSMFVVERDTNKPPRYIIHFPTKTHWRRPSTYSIVDAGLSSLATLIKQKEIKSVAMTYPGCGLGGLRKSIVGDLINRHLGVIPVTINLYG